MDCAACGHRNSTGAKFCGECGAPLSASVQCPVCSFANPEGQNFCSSCGAALTAAPPDGAARPPPEVVGERKQVTVLFADVMGSMELSESCDPEDWQQLMERFFSILSEGVQRFEGTVDKFTGDGIMALFGAPVAHEDHAQRACLAALWMTDRLADFSHASSGPAWNRYCQFGFSTLALVFAVLEAVSAIMPVNTAAVRSPLGQSGLIIWTGSWSSATFALQITASVVIWCLYAGYAAWMILVGRRLGQIGRRGAHYRLLAVRMLWVMPLFLCATNLFVNDYSPVSLTDARRDLVFACGVRVLLGLIVAYLGVRVRRATDRLLTPAP